jgi:hypothetical protein
MGLVVMGNHVGVVLTPALGKPSRFVEGFDPRHLGLSVPWAALVRIEACDPWPAFRLTTLFGKREETHDFHPLNVHRVLSFTPDDAQLKAFEELVRVVIELAEEHAPERIARGWLDILERLPEEVDALPAGEAIGDSGVYRTSERVVARRPRPGVFDVVATWLASSPEKPWRSTTRDIVMTERHVYARSWGGRCFRVPIATLRCRLTGPYGDAVYVFGKRNFVVIPRDEGCAVQKRLDARLDLRRTGGDEEILPLAS